ncbi:MAG: ATP-binding protein [Acidobacteria bacterium]|nr:ATP-binding protein [Acidobacteriota bacterium]
MRLIAWVAAAALVALPARSADLSGEPAGYSIATWSQRDGLPAGTIWALAQDAEGYLWLGSDAGLYRFDGLRFTSAETLFLPSPPRAAVRALLAQKDGTLWTGYQEPGGIVRIRAGEIRTYSRSDEPLGDVRTLREDSDGTLWAGTSRGLFRLDGEQWVAWPGDGGLPGGTAFGSFITRGGDFVVGTGDGVYRKRLGATRFEAVEVFGSVDGGVRGIAEDPHGRLVASDPRSGFRVLGHRGRSVSLERGRGIQLLADRNGDIWVATGGQGLWRVTLAADGTVTIHRAASLAGPLAEGTFSLLEDRDGNIWAGTGDGLARLTRHSVDAITDIGIIAGVQATTLGSIWVSTFDGLLEFTRRGVQWEPARRLLANERIRALHADRDGRLWFATNTIVARLDRAGGAPTTILGSRHGLEIDSLTTDGRGRVWLADARRGLLRLDADGRLAPVPLPADVHRSMVQLTYTDGLDRVWAGFANGRLLRTEPDGAVRLFGPADGAAAGDYRAVYEELDGTLWFGGRLGLTRFSDGAFATVPRSSRFPADWVKAIQQDEAGNLWLGTSAGIVRVPREEFDRTLAGQSQRSGYLLLDKLDGLAGPPRLLGDRASVRSADGRLWYVTGRGLTLVRPAEHLEQSPGPRPQVVTISVDGQQADPLRVSSLGAGTSRLEIEYSALNLTTPHKTLFRYRLDGFDTDWIDAGSRRAAFYTNLPPGRYRFRVAAGANGMWDESVAGWSFDIEPRIYQTRTFAAAGIAALLLSAWALWRMRVTRMRTQFAIVLAERMRLSREIHDTLLQGMVGVAVQCDALANVADSASVRDDLKRLRRRVEDYIREFRQSIWNLRSPTLEEHDFETALRMTAERVTASTDVALDMTTTGDRVRLQPHIEQQLLRVVHEAASNAVRHSSAQHLRVHVAYAADAVAVRIADDGQGFTPTPAGGQETRGHCGLIAMKERARTIGGELFIRSAPGRGTEVEAVVPLTRRSLFPQVAAQ